MVPNSFRTSSVERITSASLSIVLYSPNDLSTTCQHLSLIDHFDKVDEKEESSVASFLGSLHPPKVE